MIKIDVNYTDYRDDADPNYPGGKAVDAPDEESFEGTPIKAALVNDLLGSRQAIVRCAFGSLDNISKKPDHVDDSDVLKALQKIIADAIANKANKIIVESPVQSGTLETAAVGQNIGSLTFDTANEIAQTTEGLGNIMLSSGQRLEWNGSHYVLQSSDDTGGWENDVVFYDMSQSIGNRWVMPSYDFPSPVFITAINISDQQDGAWVSTSYTYQAAPTVIEDLSDVKTELLERIAAVISGQVIGGGAYWYCRMSSSTSLPEALPFSAAEPRALFDAQTSTPYSWTPTNGLIAGEPFGVQHNGSRVLVSYAFLDLEADSGFPGYLVNVVDESAPANNWQPMPDKTLRMDNDTIKSRDTDGAYEVAAQSFPITERFDKFVSGANLKFKDFWQGVLGAINGLITVQNSVQRVFDITHPIGEVYIQFPQQSAPADLYNRNGIVSGWHNISSSYAGRFFRAEGGSAAAFGTAQGGGAPNITGSVQGIDAAVGGGRSLYAGDLNDWMPVFSNISRRGRYLNFDASRSSNLYGAANEIRPENYAIRIWIRVS